MQSWGRVLQLRQEVQRLSFRDQALPLQLGRSVLPHGLGRSYGDSCLNENGTLLATRGLDRYIAFDAQSGVLRCESGVSLAEILQLVVPRGWFLPVTPGTKYVTLGGAIANDVHGKNHHQAGTFGCHVRAFELLRSDGSRRICTAQDNAEWFGATIGGLGLTGLITWAELQLKPIRSPLLEVQTQRFVGLAEFFRLSRESDASHEYTVAWIDCLSREGRGVFLRADHASGGNLARERVRGPRLSVPFTPPLSPVGRLSLRAFNALYFRSAREGVRLQHYEPYFYPLDRVGEWNRLYGPRGFFQYQCVVPEQGAIVELLQAIAAAGQGSFLAVLKGFGAQASPGWLSFARPGWTLALDFPNRGEPTRKLFERLDGVVANAHGAIYPAKDARMPAKLFKTAFPRWQELEKIRDPEFSSSFWRRVTQSS